MTRPPHFIGLVLVAHTVSLAVAWAQDEPLRTAADRDVDIRHITLELDVSIEEKSVAGTATLEFAAIQPVARLRLDAVNHDVEGVCEVDTGSHRKRPLEFENTGEQLIVDLDGELSRGEVRRVQIAYEVHEPQNGLFFFQPSEAEPDVPFMAWTQGEPRRNQYWFPCLDHPNERQTTELIATVNSRFRVLSNGTLISRESLGEGNRVRFHWRQDQPHVAYLVSMVVGEFAVAEATWRGKPVLYYAPPNRRDDIERTFGRTPEMLEFFSERFGIEYQWDKYAQVVVEQFIIGGMENTSATTLYQGVMHDERALLGSTPDRLIAHELGHQWWGDLVTCRDWAHLWLNEGFATYCEVLWYEHKLGQDEADYLLWQKSKLARSGPALERPIVDRRYPNPNSMFDARAYPKGGWVLHMLRHKVGDADFFRALQRYGTANALQTAETSDLRKAFAELTGLSLERFFYNWTERPGHPILTVKSTYEPDDKLMRVSVEQMQKGEPFHFPLTIELVGKDSPDTRRITRDVTEKEVTLYVPMPDRPKLVRIDPDYALLAEIKEEKSRDWWQAQLREALRVPERIRAVEHFAQSKSDADRTLLAEVLHGDDFWGVRAQAAPALGKVGGDESREALIVGLQDEHARVRLACAEALNAFTHDPAAAEALRQALEAEEASYHVRAATIESLAKVEAKPPLEPFLAALESDSHRDVIRQAALRGLARVEEEQALDLLVEWTRRGHSLDCRRTAIASTATYLARHRVPEAQVNNVVETLQGYLRAEGPRVRRSAASALGNLRSLAEPALDALQQVAEHDADQRVRRAAESAVGAIREGGPPRKEVDRLRTELQRLSEVNEDLQQRLQKLEAK